MLIWCLKQVKYFTLKFLALNQMHIKLTSLIICFINDNLINASSAPPPEGKRSVFYIEHFIILSTSKETSIY